MPRNFNKYQYETSPRKIEPEYTPIKNPYKNKKSTAKKTKKTNNKTKEKQLKKQKAKAIKYLLIGFSIIFAICYRNSQIDESFATIQNLKSNLEKTEKENTQLKISIENGLNLSNLEQEAKEKLGMQKLTAKQTTYIHLPKNDYIESATEQVIIEKEDNWFKCIINTITNIFK